MNITRTSSEKHIFIMVELLKVWMAITLLILGYLGPN